MQSVNVVSVFPVLVRAQSCVEAVLHLRMDFTLPDKEVLYLLTFDE